MHRLELSIITVVFNAKNDLECTIRSIKNIKDSRVQYIVVDGGSTDGTIDVIKADKSIDKWVSGPDDGIFEAMNIGINMATGQWIIFINAGDEVRFDKSIVSILEQYNESALLYGNTVRGNGTISRPLPLSVIKSGRLPMCHQATFYNREVLKSHLFYDTTFQLYGENELLMRIYKRGYKLSYLDQTIAYFQGGGVSDRISWETRRARYYYLWKHFGLLGVVNGLLVKICALK